VKFTNNLHLPEAVCEAVKNDPYDAGESDITVTQLISPPQQVALRRYFKEELVEDISDRIYALMGKAMHVVLERANITGITEKRLYAEVDGWLIGGTFDSICLAQDEDEKWVLQDYKQMSIWEVIFGLREEKTQQLNMLDWLFTMSHDEAKTYPPIDRLEIVAIFRDWSKPEAGRRAKSGDETYPKNQVGIIPVTRWGFPDQQKFVQERVTLHQAARLCVENKHIQKLAPCSDDERWASSTKFALMKEGRKSAIKVAENLEELKKHALDKGWLIPGDDPESIAPANMILPPPYSVDVRLGENRRCNDYCDVAYYCNQLIDIEVAAKKAAMPDKVIEETLPADPSKNAMSIPTKSTQNKEKQ